MNKLLLGDEAVALGAIDAGIAGAFSYPGTPATEIFEFIEKRAADHNGIAAQWSLNEKIAYEEALGMSFAGQRALVSMKHVGLNVAADPFMSSALTGAHAGLVLAVADDPSMHSSQNEQDSRFYGQFAKIPIFEPADQQQAYDMTREAFVVSESFHLPVMLRLVTRLAHSRSAVRTAEPSAPPTCGRASDWRKWTLLPVNARVRFRHLLDLQQALESYAQDSSFNTLALRGTTGIISSGLARNYVDEILGTRHDHSVLKIGVYPLPVRLIRELIDHCTEIVVVEEGYPFIEKQLRGLLGMPGKVLRGKCDGTLPDAGELNADAVRRALGQAALDVHGGSTDLPARPPQLCQGCPHCDAFRAITDASEDQVRPYYFSDIGCYTLAALPPHDAIDTCVDMGASIGMGLGAAKAGAYPVVCTIGDSTFMHSGMGALVTAARLNANMTVVILDNATVAMTGGQEVFVSGDDLVNIVKGLGVDPQHLHIIEPLPKKHEHNVELIRREMEYRGLSVIIACRPCIQLKRKSTQETEVAVSTTAS